MASVAKRPVDHLNLALIRRVIRVALGCRKIPVTQPLLKRPHRAPRQRPSRSPNMCRKSRCLSDKARR